MERVIAAETVLSLEYWERLLGLPGATDQLLVFDHYRRCRALAREGMRTRNLPVFPMEESHRNVFPRAVFLLIYSMSGDALVRAQISEFHTRTRLNLARTALAVERFRGATGRLPERLEELVPEWLDEVPADYWNDGKPLSYRVREDGEYVVCSVRSVREEESDENKESPEHRTDLTFTVLPPEARAELRMSAAAEAAS